MFIHLYGVFLQVAALLHPKAKLFVQGRKDVFQQLEKWKASFPNDPVLWFHAASLGEFEQGRPIIEACKTEFPDYKVVLTFFSPSGFEVRKNYSGADLILYLPMDTPSHAKRFVKTLQPSLAVWVKYEYWANYFFQLKKADVPVVLVSAIFRPNQRFFRNYSSFWKNILLTVDHFFLQNQTSADLLKSIGVRNYSVVGDTRFDRVVEVASVKKELPVLHAFKDSRFLIVLGSSYAQEESAVDLTQTNIRYVVAPHVVNSARIKELQAKWGEKAVLYSAGEQSVAPHHQVLIVDNIGLLMHIYAYADLAIVGGAFGKGLHNVLEAAVYGIPVLFGPNFKKFDEAKGLVEVNAAFVAHSEVQLSSFIQRFLSDENHRSEAGKKAKLFVEQGKGAQERVLIYLKTRLRGK